MATEIMVYGEIGDGWGDGITAFDFASQLRGIPISESELNIRINSPGGAADEGIAIYNVVKSFSQKRKLLNSNFRINTIVDGFAFSAASIVAMGGDEVIMNQSSMLMIHNAWTMAMGDAKELLDIANFLAKLDAEIGKIYSAKTGISEADIKALMSNETFFTAEEAISGKFANKIGELQVVQNSLVLDPDMLSVANGSKRYASVMASRKQKVSKPQQQQIKFEDRMHEIDQLICDFELDLLEQ